MSVGAASGKSRSYESWSSSELEIRPTCGLFGAVPDDLELDEYDDAAQVLLRREGR